MTVCLLVYGFTLHCDVEVHRGVNSATVGRHHFQPFPAAQHRHHLLSIFTHSNSNLKQPLYPVPRKKKKAPAPAPTSPFIRRLLCSSTSRINDMIVCTSAMAGVNGRFGLESAVFESMSGRVGGGEPSPTAPLRFSPRDRERDRVRSGSKEAMPNDI